MSNKQKQCRLEKATEVKVYPQGDGRFVARTQGKGTGYMVVWEDRYRRWDCPCKDFRHRAKYVWFKCKHVLAIEQFIASQEKTIGETFDTIAHLEKTFGCKVTGVVSASRINGNGTFKTVLSAKQRSGLESEIDTTLDEATLKALGYDVPVKVTNTGIDEPKSEPEKAERQSLSAEVVDEIEIRAQAIWKGYQAQPLSTIYSCMAKVARKLSGIDAGMIKEHYFRQYDTRVLHGIDPAKLAEIGAELQGAASDEKLRKNLEREIRGALAEIATQEAHVSPLCPDNGSEGVEGHKKQAGCLRSAMNKICPECGAECKGRFCPTCTDRMLGAWDGNTVNLPTTKANVRIPTADDNESKSLMKVYVTRTERGRWALKTDDENGFPGDVLVEDECVMLNDFKSQT